MTIKTEQKKIKEEIKFENRKLEDKKKEVQKAEKSISQKLKNVEIAEKSIDKKIKKAEKKEASIKKQISATKKLKLKVKKSGDIFQKELRKSIATAIVAAFSFLMALSWRDVITGYVTKITQITNLQGQLFSAIIVTVISVIGILIITKYVSVK